MARSGKTTRASGNGMTASYTHAHATGLAESLIEGANPRR